jgi:hypothetical protein
VADKIIADKAKALPFILVAFDSRTPNDDPVFVEIADALCPYCGPT